MKMCVVYEELGGSGQYAQEVCSPEKICFLKLYNILDHFSRFVNPSLQLHMQAMPEDN